MFRLRTFGGLSIERDGVVLDQLSAQRKALAVLAVLAASQPVGVSRDKLLALFWPESDTDRARGALKQLLHVLRRDLGAEVVRGTAELRLDPSHLESDVGIFRQAISTGDHDTAVRTYTGVFLDGVHLDDAAEFERWVDDEAGALTRAHADALERLARDAESRNEWSRAADFWRRSYLIDPLNTRIAIGLVNALDAGGDRAGALKLAREHDQRLKTELDLAPDPALAALVARLRATEAAPSVRSVHASPATAEPAVAAVAVPLEAAPAPKRLHRRRARYAVGVAAAAAVLFVVVLAAKNTLSDDIELDPRRVAVAVFENRSGDTRLDLLGSVAADWVTRGITRSLPLRVLDEATLYVEGRTAAGAPTDPRVLARRNGAGLVVSGSYYTTNDSVYFSARVVQAANGEVLRSLDPVGAPLTDPLPAVEELRQRVATALASVTEPTVRPYHAQPPRYDAYQEYVAAENVYWRGLFGEAMPLYARAAALDSTFLLAEVRHGVAAVGVGRCDLADSIRRKLEPRLDRLGPEERIMLQLNAARCESNWDEALRLSRARAALLPSSIQRAWPAAANARRGHRPAEALSILEPMNPARDRWALHRDKMFYWREVTAAQHVLGEHGAELRTVREAERFGKNRLGIVHLHARALIGAGRSTDALRTIEHIELLDSDPVLVVSEIAWQMNPRRLATPGWVLHQLATELLAHQAGDQARGLLERADRWFRRRPAEEASRLEHRLTHARVLELLGHYDEAERLLRMIGAHDSLNLDHRGMLGVIAARRGDRAEAQRVDQLLAGLTTHRPPGAPGLYRAQIAALLGDHTRALDLLEALPYRVHPADPLFFHSDPAFLPLHGTPRFEAFVRPRG